jgi:hypothetical protein
MSAYDAAGKRNSSKTHARRGHPCEFCESVSFGNGGRVTHARKHVQSGEAVELVKWYATESAPGRVFLPASDEARISEWFARGYAPVSR